MIGLLNFASFVAQIAMRRAARERLIPNMQCPKLGTKTNSGAGGQRRRMRIGTGEVPMESVFGSLPSQRGKSAELEFETKKMGDEIEFGPPKNDGRGLRARAHSR